MRRDYRTPTEEEKKRLDAARTVVQRGIEGEQDFLSKLSPTYAKGARDEIRRGMKLRESVDRRAREGEAYNQAGYSAGGTTGGAGPRRASDPVPGTRGPVRPPSVPGGSAMPVDRPASSPAPDYEPPQSPKLLQRALDSRMKQVGQKAKGGTVKKYAGGGSIDGCAQHGKTKGRVV